MSCEPFSSIISTRAAELINTLPQTHVSYTGFPGITVGQAHLLDDVIDNLELELAANGDESQTSYYASRTLTYSLGTEHDLYKGLMTG
jgi:m7GpppX diphosphatase